ncbi:unnamed protein product [Calypogeia fissa]
MEGGYGSSMMLVFAFLRWVLLLNFILSIVWLALMILPFLVHPPLSFHWRSLQASFGTASGIKQVIQGLSLERTFVFYGGYTYTYNEQKGLWRVDYMYPLLIGATFLLSFLGILGRIARRIMNAGDISMAAHYFPFSSLVFASWDFHITSLEAAAKLRRGVRMQLKELYADALIKKMRKSRPMHHCMSATRFLALCILWPLTMVGVVFAVDGLSKNTNLINSYFGSDYAQAVLFGLLNNSSPVLVRLLVEMENFKPATAERVVLSKLFFLRFLNLATFYSSSIRVLLNTRKLRSINGHEGNCFDTYCAEGLHCCDKPYLEWDICDIVDIQMCLCVPTCAENYVGGQVLRLIVISSIARAAFELGYGYGYLCFYHGNKRQLLIEDMAMDVVYVQALVWWGVCFSPMAPIIGFFSNLFTFYTMKLALFKTCAPVEKAFSASRTSTLTYGVLLVSLILSTIPVSILVMEKKDGFCGPIYTQSSMYDVVSTYMQKAPSSLWLAFTWILNPAVLIGVIFFLIFIVVLVQSQLIETRQFLALTKFEMGSQRKEANEKLKRLRQGVQTSLHKSTTGSLTSLQLSTALNELNWFRKPTLSPADESELDPMEGYWPSVTDSSKQDADLSTSSHTYYNNDNLGLVSGKVEGSQEVSIESQKSLIAHPPQGTDQMPIEDDKKTIDGQDWHSLGKILRRLSQTQQNEMEVSKHAHQQVKQESSLEDWHSLGHILRRLSQQNGETHHVSTREDQVAAKVQEAVIIDDSLKEVYSKLRAPIFSHKIHVHDEDTHLENPAQLSLSVKDPLEVHTSIGSSKSFRSKPIEFSTRYPEALEPATSQMDPSTLDVSNADSADPLNQDSTVLGPIEQERRVSSASKQPNVEPVQEPLPQQNISIIDSFLSSVKESIKNRLRKQVRKKYHDSQMNLKRGRQRKKNPSRTHGKTSGSTSSTSNKSKTQ